VARRDTLLRRAISVQQQKAEIVEARRRVGMLGAEHLLADRQRALVERPAGGEVALGLEQAGEVGKARRRVGVLGSPHLLADCQGALAERPGGGEVALGLEQIGEVREVATDGLSSLGGATFEPVTQPSALPVTLFSPMKRRLRQQG
jgi:hypothetical protein